MTGKTKDSEHTYAVESLKAAELLVDKRVQRDGLQQLKVDRIVANFNPDALGVVHVSRRTDGDYVIDGWHRKEAVVRKTDGAGTVVCHVYTGLTLQEEAKMFLDLNYANQPNPLEKHKARVTAQDPQALRVDEAVHMYGWTISPDPANGNVAAVQRLYSIDNLSQKIEADPSLLQMTFLVITRAWGTDRAGVKSVIMDGIARLFAEHGSRINVDHLIDRLKNRPGGPVTLHTEAAQYANLEKGRVSMAIAHLITEWYNKGKGTRSTTSLPPWRKRA